MTNPRPVRAWAVLVLALLTAQCAASPSRRPLDLDPVPTGPGTLADVRRSLEGEWTLVSFEVHPPGRPAVPIRGTGRLTYDAYANLAMDVRADESAVQALRDAGIVTAERGISIKGRTVLDVEHHTLTFVINEPVAAGPTSGPLALSRPRHWQLDGDVLTLTTHGDDGKPMSVGRWRKTS